MVLLTEVTPESLNSQEVPCLEDDELLTQHGLSQVAIVFFMTPMFQMYRGLC